MRRRGRRWFGFEASLVTAQLACTFYAPTCNASEIILYDTCVGVAEDGVWGVIGDLCMRFLLYEIPLILFG